METPQKPTTFEQFKAAREEFRAEARARDDKAYSLWIDKQMTLSIAMLTLLVTFQEKYVSANPKLSFLVPLCWICLAVSAIASVIANAGEAFVGARRQGVLTDKIFEAIQELRESNDRAARDQINNRLMKQMEIIGYDRHRRAQRAADIAFVAMIGGIVALVVFAIVNWKY